MSADAISTQNIVDGLRAAGVREGDRLFVHSSLSAFGYVVGGASAVCRALIRTVGDRGTVAVPTFTWGANHAAEVVRFRVAEDPCETGAIPEAFRMLPEAVRSDHVCHSVAAAGRDAAQVMGDGVLPFGPGSSMHALVEYDYRYMFLGCGFGPCTALHVAEELASVPYRYYRHFSGSIVVRADGTEAPSHAREFLRYEPFRNDFLKMEPILEERGLLSYGRIGAAEVILTSARSIVHTAVELLRRDPGFLLTPASAEYLRHWGGPTGSAGTAGPAGD